MLTRKRTTIPYFYFRERIQYRFMFRTIFFLLSLVLSTASTAQETSVQPPYITIDSDTEFDRIIGEHGGHLFMLSSDKITYYISEYDTTQLNLIRKTELKIPKRSSKQLELKGTLFVGNRLKIIIKQDAPYTSQFSFSVFDWNENGLDEASEVVVPLSGSQKSDNFIVTSNALHNSVLIGRSSEDSGRDRFVHELFLINEESNILRTIHHDSPLLKGKNQSNTTYIGLNNRQQVMIYELETLFNNEDKKHHSRIVLKTFNNEEEPILSSVEIPAGAACRELVYSENGGHPMMIGTYQSFIKKEVNGLVGLMRIPVSEDGQLGAPIYTKYSEASRLKTLRGADITDGIHVRPFYNITDCITDTEGNLYVIQERRTVTNMGMGVYEWYYGSLLVSKFDKGGNLLWDNVIWKSQFFKINSVPIIIPLVGTGFALIISIPIPKTDDGYLSYKATVDGDRLRIFFNDMESNEKRDHRMEREPYTKPEKGLPYEATVAADGTFTYQCRKDLKPAGEPFVLQFGLECNGWLYLVSKDKGRVGLLSKVKF